MEKIAFISGGTFIYWSSIILTLAAVTAICVYAALYLGKSGNGLALCMSVPIAVFLSIILGRLVHWYCRADGYASFQAAMTDYSWGGYALMGIFAGCILTACLLRLMGVTKDLPQMLDCMALGGGAGIVVGRLSFLFNASDRGVIVPDWVKMPFAYPVTNTVSGVVENRLATFMLQSMTTAVIVIALLIFMGICGAKKKKIPSGDIALLFLACYGSCQIIMDSTRYDSLFMRSNGFISIVQILGLLGLLTAIVVFSVRMVKNAGLKFYHFIIWVGMLGLLGGAGYMEYYVQRHGDQAMFAYSIMSACVFTVVALTILVRILAGKVQKQTKSGKFAPKK